jgi:hypothetical protein
MEMVGQQTIRMNLPGGLPTGLGKGLDKTLTILVVLEDGFTPVTPVHDVVDGPRILDSQLARHGAKNATAPLTIKSFI